MGQNSSGHISGSVSEQSVLALLHNFYADKVTGILEVQLNGLAKQLFIEKGEVVFATSSDLRENLAYLLLRVGRITRQQFDKTDALTQATGKRQGALLVESGFITPKELFWGVKLQVSEIVFSLLSQQEGDYVFLKTPIPRSDIIILKLHTPSLVMEGLRRFFDPAQAEWAVGPDDGFLRGVQAEEGWLGTAVMTDEEMKIWKLVVPGNTVGKAIEESGLPRDMALRIICTFISAGLAERTDEEVCVVERMDPDMVRVEATVFHGAMQGKNHYEVLGVSTTATSKEIRSAYVALSKKFHPDCHSVPELEDIRKILEEIFARITQAYDMLMDDVKRRDYDMFLATSAPPTRMSAHPKRSQDTDSAVDVEKAKSLFERGMVEFRKGNYWGAVDNFLWAVRLNPSCGQYYLYAGKCLQHMPRRLDEAEEYLLKAADIDKFNIENHVDLGRYYNKIGIKDKAESAFREALRLDPTNADALAALGVRPAKESSASHESRDKGLLGRLFGK